MTAFTTTQVTPFTTSSAAARSSFFALAAVVTLSLLASVGGLADHQYDSALVAQANSVPTQVVVVTAQRLPRG